MNEPPANPNVLLQTLRLFLTSSSAVFAIIAHCWFCIVLYAVDRRFSSVLWPQSEYEVVVCVVSCRFSVQTAFSCSFVVTDRHESFLQDRQKNFEFHSFVNISHIRSTGRRWFKAGCINLVHKMTKMHPSISIIWWQKVCRDREVVRLNVHPVCVTHWSFIGVRFVTMTLITALSPNELIVLLLVLFISIFQQSVLLLLNSKVWPSDRSCFFSAGFIQWCHHIHRTDRSARWVTCSDTCQCAARLSA